MKKKNPLVSAIQKSLSIISLIMLVVAITMIFFAIDCQVKCNKINKKIYKALRGEYESQDVYEDDY